MASRTRARVASSTLAWPFDTRDTVCEDTPARRATSAIDGRGVAARLPRVDVMGPSLSCLNCGLRHMLVARYVHVNIVMFTQTYYRQDGTTAMAVNPTVAPGARAAPRRRGRRARRRA